ncbi:hypothetical protein D3C72_2313510 [compost metagenome]
MSVPGESHKDIGKDQESDCLIDDHMLAVTPLAVGMIAEQACDTSVLTKKI